MQHNTKINKKLTIIVALLLSLGSSFSFTAGFRKGLSPLDDIIWEGHHTFQERADFNGDVFILGNLLGNVTNQFLSILPSGMTYDMKVSSALYANNAGNASTVTNGVYTNANNTFSGNNYFPGELGNSIWNTSGYVGIGTSSPLRMLHLVSGNNAGLAIENVSGAQQRWDILGSYTGSDRPLVIYDATAGKTALYISSFTEYVGINKLNPAYQLDVNGYIHSNYGLDIISTQNRPLSVNTTMDGSHYLLYGDANNWWRGDGALQINSSLYSNGSIYPQGNLNMNADTSLYFYYDSAIAYRTQGKPSLRLLTRTMGEGGYYNPSGYVDIIDMGGWTKALHSDYVRNPTLCLWNYGETRYMALTSSGTDTAAFTTNHSSYSFNTNIVVNGNVKSTGAYICADGTMFTSTNAFVGGSGGLPSILPDTTKISTGSFSTSLPLNYIPASSTNRLVIGDYTPYPGHEDEGINNIYIGNNMANGSYHPGLATNEMGWDIWIGQGIHDAGGWTINIGENMWDNYNKSINVGHENNNNHDGGVTLGWEAHDNYGDAGGTNYWPDGIHWGGGTGIGSAAHYNYLGGVGVGYGAGWNHHRGVGVGSCATHNSYYSVGVGYFASCNDHPYSMALGPFANVTADFAVAIGSGAVNDSTGTAKFAPGMGVVADYFVGDGSRLTNVGAVGTVLSLERNQTFVTKISSLSFDGDGITSVTDDGDGHATITIPAAAWLGGSASGIYSTDKSTFVYASYITHPSITADTQFVDKKYIDDIRVVNYDSATLNYSVVIGTYAPPSTSYNTVDAYLSGASNSPPPYVVTQSAQIDPAWRLWDAYSYRGWTYYESALPAWVELDMGTSKKVNQYGLLGFSDYGAGAQPAAWTIEGSDDNSTWTTVDSQSGITWTDWNEKVFTASNPGTYRYWKFTVTAIYGPGNYYAALAKLRYITVDTPDSALYRININSTHDGIDISYKGDLFATFVGSSAVSITPRIDVSSVTASGYIQHASKTQAELELITPTATGQTYYCSDTGEMWVSSGTSQNAFYRYAHQ